RRVLFRSTGDTENYEKYYRLQVILKVPFRGNQPFDDLLRDPDNNIVHETWQSRFESLNIDALEAPELPEAQDEGIVPERLNELDIVEPFMVAAAMVNNQQSINGQPTVDSRFMYFKVFQVSHYLCNFVLGQRAMDLTHDWTVLPYGLPPVQELIEQVNHF